MVQKLAEQDHTFELLTYRKPPYGKSRFANIQIVLAQKENSQVFNCVDKRNKQVLIFPRGLDPVFCGIRGENPEAIWLYWDKIQPQPDINFWMIFRTNQGTNNHLNQTPLNTLNVAP